LETAAETANTSATAVKSRGASSGSAATDTTTTTTTTTTFRACALLVTVGVADFIVHLSDHFEHHLLSHKLHYPTNLVFGCVPQPPLRPP
jgi:hypothetical protein